MAVDPIVIVKRADGTFVKVPLSELKKKISPTTPKPLPSTSSGQALGQEGRPAVSNPPLTKRGEGELPKPALGSASSATPLMSPLSKGGRPTAPAPKKDWSREDSKSLLEERRPVKSPAVPPLSDSRTNQVDTVIKKLDFSVPENFKNRLRSVVQLKLKDIKSEEEVKEILLKSIKDGGLGLTEQQADKIIKFCADTAAPSKTNEPVMALKKSLRDMAPSKSLPMVEPPAVAVAMAGKPEIPATSTPFNAFVTPPHPPLEKGGDRHPPLFKEGAGGGQDFVSKLVQQERAGEPVFKFDAQKIRKPIKDITAPPMEFGPVEEIKYFTLVDFRRLSSDPKESARRLSQKLQNLKDESFLLYLDGKSAHFQSPLYKDYLAVLSDSLSNRQTLVNACNQKGRMNITELNAIIEMEKEI